MVDATESGCDVQAALIEEGRLIVRLFNAEGNPAPALSRVFLHRRVSKVMRVELDGRLIEELPVKSAADGRRCIQAALPRFGLCTLRCELGE